MTKIPVTLITGFLGAGKTTLVNAFLKQTEEKIALIINEFGDISIDDRLITTQTDSLIQLASGSICCSVKDDLMQVLAGLISPNAATEGGARHIDRVVIETTGLADPIPLIEAFGKKPMLYERYELPHVITVVDAFHIAEQLQSHEEAVPQIAVADVVLINKIDLVPDIDAIESLVRRINPVARILTSTQSSVPISDLLRVEMGVEKYIPSLEEVESDSAIHEHEEHIETCVLRETRPLDLQKVGLFIAQTILLDADRFVRYKGLLNIAGMDERFVFQGIHTQFENRKDRPWHTNEERVSEVVLIGHDLDREALQKSFEECVA